MLQILYKIPNSLKTLLKLPIFRGRKKIVTSQRHQLQASSPRAYLYIAAKKYSIEGVNFFTFQAL